ncbi:HUWE1-associated protein modifying stress responses [Cylas formicarius]|uniref:HUWE1-associated protein modifying stress responses n=1 Tax=Cylas formicarius TaxID=197179 RepID=UPI0029589F7B|nr:HUWE1-associated protein modifying stress responses [Cylas formicarius]
MNGEGDDESWLSGWEQQCADAIEGQPDHDRSLLEESDNSQRRIWTCFQDSATAVAQLYRDRYSGEPAAIWLQFQTAAGTVTSLYRDSCESLKKTNELARQSGYQKRNNELLHWAKRKRRLIRREDLLAYLAGKPPPPRQSHHHRLSPRPRNLSPPPHHHPLDINREPGTPHLPDPNLHMFREALALTTTRQIARGASTPTTGSDLCAFIAGEMARHCVKRPASPHDVPMGSPTHQKRARYM